MTQLKAGDTVKTLDDLKIGDLLEDENGGRRKVLDIMVKLSLPIGDRLSVDQFGGMYSIDELKIFNHKIVSTTAVTRQQIADKFGVPVDELIIEGEK